MDETKPCGQAAMTLAESGHEEALTAGSQPQYGRFLLAHLEANSGCQVLLVAYMKGGDVFPNNWLPVFLTLDESEPRIAPPRSSAWPWFQAGTPFEIYAVFFAKETPELDELHGQIAQLNDPLLDLGLFKLLAHRLRDQLTQWAAGSLPSAEPPPVANDGKLAGWEQFPWRLVGPKVNFDPAHPGVIAFRCPGK